LLEKYQAQLPAFFIVSQVQLAGSASANAQKSETLPGLSVDVSRAEGAKCERCWNFSMQVGESADYPTICERCVKALDEIDASGQVGGQVAASR
jgi:isoleucyl-tRNA synthetase